MEANARFLGECQFKFGGIAKFPEEMPGKPHAPPCLRVSLTLSVSILHRSIPHVHVPRLAVPLPTLNSRDDGESCRVLVFEEDGSTHQCKTRNRGMGKETCSIEKLVMQYVLDKPKIKWQAIRTLHSGWTEQESYSPFIPSYPIGFPTRSDSSGRIHLAQRRSVARLVFLFSE